MFILSPPKEIFAHYNKKPPMRGDLEEKFCLKMILDV